MIACGLRPLLDLIVRRPASASQNNIPRIRFCMSLIAGSTTGASGQEHLDKSDRVGERRKVARRDVLGLHAEAVTDEAVHEGDWEEAVVRRRDPSHRDRGQGRERERVCHDAAGLLAVELLSFERAKSRTAPMTRTTA